MFCGECGTENPDTNSYCKNCGGPLKKPQGAAPAAPVQPAPPSYYAPPVGATAPVVLTRQVEPRQIPVKKGRNWLGGLSVVAGIASFAVFPYILGAVAIILGGYSVYATRKKTGNIAIIAIAGIVIGLAAILVDNFYFVLFPPKEVIFSLLGTIF